MNAGKELIRIEAVSKNFGDLQAVDSVSLSIYENEFFALLGPSGGGKTTLLRLLAGFEQPDSGHLLLDGQDLVGVKPYRRPVNMMFQSYALFPHMTVFNNIAYGLRQEKLAKAEITRRANEVLEMVGMAHLGHRKPHNLSGGQRQRVALARAVVKRPRVLLLDEPLAALDRKLRVEMRLELKRLQHEVGITFIIVTHDQEEALVMADRAAIMDHGRVLQVGSVVELYEQPNSLFVANFIGESNTFAGRLQHRDNQPGVTHQDGRFWPVSTQAYRRLRPADGAEVSIVVRPERLNVEPATQPPPDVTCYNTLPGTLADIVYLGSLREYLINLADGTTALAQVQVGQHNDDLTSGTPVNVSWEIAHGVLVVH
jgi:putrescine transport system ATP-binding protein